MPTKNERDVEEHERNFIRTRASENGKDRANFPVFAKWNMSYLTADDGVLNSNIKFKY